MSRPAQKAHGHPEPELAPGDFRAIARTLREKTGIDLSAKDRSLVIARLARHLERLGQSDFGGYLDLVTRPGNEAELSAMIEALTTNTTRFFRERDHFDLLARQVMPRLIRSARAGGRVRLWSAGCSSGEEAYSIAATVLTCFPDAPSHDIRILGTDINRTVLRTAEAGRYDPRVAMALGEAMRGVIFEPEGKDDGIVVRQALRDLVSFRYLNFVEPWPVRGPFDVIFCRNAAIYMDVPTQAQLWHRLDSVLADEGVLFIGHADRLCPGLASRLDLLAPTTFRRRAASRGQPPSNESR